MTPPVQVVADPDFRFGLPICWSSAMLENAPRPLKLLSTTTPPESAEHSACTLARFGFEATLPYGAVVMMEHASNVGTVVTSVVGGWNSSATFGARFAS